MFTRIFNSLKETITRSPNHRTNNTKHTSDSASEYSYDSCLPSIADELQSNIDNHSILSKLPSTQPLPIRTNRNNSISEPIPIGSVNSEKRRGSLFGISNVTYDDYMQKDLISSSWR